MSATSSERGAIIGARIKKCRDIAGVTQEDLATEAGMSQATLSRLEQGRGPFEAPRVLAIAEALGVSIGLFFGPLNVEGQVVAAARPASADSGMEKMKRAAEEYLADYRLVTGRL